MTNNDQPCVQVGDGGIYSIGTADGPQRSIGDEVDEAAAAQGECLDQGDPSDLGESEGEDAERYKEDPEEVEGPDKCTHITVVSGPSAEPAYRPPTAKPPAPP